MRTLNLTLKKKWFDMIAIGEKKEEYRDIKEYFVCRLLKIDFIIKLGDVITYKSLKSAFWHSLGHERYRFQAVNYLIEKGATFKEYDLVVFKNGNSKNCHKIELEFKGIEIRYGRPEWGADPGVKYFVIKLGKLLKYNNKHL